MNEMVNVHGTKMQVREYKGQRVVTFKDIDTVHQRPSGTASRNFKHNKKHFVENEDFVIVTRESPIDEIRPLNFSIPPKGITLLTESGYLMLTKSFTDDLSWQVQRQLVNAYFRVKNQPVGYGVPSKREKYRTSSTPVPKNPSWYSRNRARVGRICDKADVPASFLYHHILLRLGDEYDLDQANEIYERETGRVPKYPMDIVSYFPELGIMADNLLENVEKVVENW